MTFKICMHACLTLYLELFKINLQFRDATDTLTVALMTTNP